MVVEAPPSVEVESLQIQLKSRDNRYEISNEILKVSISTGVTELNKIVKRFLLLSADEADSYRSDLKKFSFNFFIDDKKIDVDLASFINENQLETESLISIEYEPELKLSESDIEKIPHNDWIGAINSSSNGSLLSTGCFDGSVWIFSGKPCSDLVHKKVNAHSMPITSICWLNDKFLTTSSDDCTVKVWAVQENCLFCVREMKHLSRVKSVDCESISPDMSTTTQSSSSYRILTGGADLTLRLWVHDLLWDATETPDESSQDKRKARKRSKTTEFDPKLNAVLTVSGCHDAEIADIKWMPYGQCATAGWDQRIKLWNIDGAYSYHTFTGNFPFLSIDYSPSNQLIVASSTDHNVRLFDSRVNNPKDCDEHALSKFSNHRRWVSQVKWNRSKDHLFCSADGLGNVRIWDIRNPSGAILNLCKHSGIAFSIAWYNDDQTVLSGGQDSMLFATTVNNL